MDCPSGSAFLPVQSQKFQICPTPRAQQRGQSPARALHFQWIQEESFSLWKTKGPDLGVLLEIIKLFREEISPGSFVKQLFPAEPGPQNNERPDTEPLFAGRERDPGNVNQEPGAFSSLMRCEKSTEPRQGSQPWGGCSGASPFHPTLLQTPQSPFDRSSPAPLLRKHRAWKSWKSLESLAVPGSSHSFKGFSAEGNQPLKSG